MSSRTVKTVLLFSLKKRDIAVKTCYNYVHYDK